jgi:hypothetical protein
LMKVMMKNQPDPPVSNAGQNSRELRSQAEQLLEQQRPGREGQETAEFKSTIHELQVHQIELELQNQELQQAHLETELARRNYFDLFDLAPVGYATFRQKREILDINLTGSRLLEEERARLVNQRFQLFLTPGHIPLFNEFIGKVFSTGTSQICEVSIDKNGDRPAVGRLEGILAEPNVVHVMDIEDRKKIEEEVEKSRNELEIRVQEQTADLKEAKELLEEQSRISESFFRDAITPPGSSGPGFKFPPGQ